MGELKALAEKFQNNGIKTVAISMGKGGAMIVRDKFVARCPALSVKAHSTVGAGDAMVAALAYSWDKKLGDEETVRLHSHIHGMQKILQESEGVGRKMDFMAQEMNREANTILSKSNDLEVSNIAIDLKTEIEKIREQIQNIE